VAAGTARFSVASMTAPGARFIEPPVSPPDQPAGKLDASVSASALHACELLLRTVIMRLADDPGSMVRSGGETAIVGGAIVHTGTTASVTVTFAVPALERLLVDPLAVTDTAYVPSAYPAGTATLSVVCPCWPGFTAIDVLARVAEKVPEAADASVKASCPHAAELLFRTVTASCVDLPCSAEAATGESVTVGADATQVAVP